MGKSANGWIGKSTRKSAGKSKIWKMAERGDNAEEVQAITTIDAEEEACNAKTQFGQLASEVVSFHLVGRIPETK